MKKKLFQLLILSIGMFSSAISYSGYVNGNKLIDQWGAYKRCAENRCDKDTAVEASLYMGYVIGVYDATGHLYSSQPDVQASQIINIFGKYLEQHPEEWNQVGSSLIKKALLQTFPKKK